MTPVPGKTYRTRRGERVRVVSHYPDCFRPYFVQRDNGACYFVSTTGHVTGYEYPAADDLVEELDNAESADSAAPNC